MADDFSGKTGVEGETRAMKGERGRLTASTPITSSISVALDWNVGAVDPGKWFQVEDRWFMRLRDNDPRGLWMEEGCGPSILPCSNCGSLNSAVEENCYNDGLRKITCSECNATTGWCVRPDERNAWNNDPLDLSDVVKQAPVRDHSISLVPPSMEEMLRNTPLPSIEDIVTPSMPIPDPSTSQLLITLADLEAAEAAYRKIHDLAGDGNIRTGRAWDHMRRCGDHARMVLAPYRSAALVEKKEEE